MRFVVAISLGSLVPLFTEAQQIDCIQESKIKTKIEQDPEYLDSDLAQFKSRINQQTKTASLKKMARDFTYRYVELKDCQKSPVGGGWVVRVLESLEKKVSVVRDRIKDLTPSDPKMFEVIPGPRRRGVASEPKNKKKSQVPERSR